MATALSKHSTASNVIDFCNARRTRLVTNRKGGYKEAPSPFMVNLTTLSQRHTPTPDDAA